MGVGGVGGMLNLLLGSVPAKSRVVLRKTGDGDFTKPLGKAGAEETPQKTPQKILTAIRENPYVGTQDIAYRIGVERSTVARAIAKMKASGQLRRVGPDKGGHWEVVSG